MTKIKTVIVFILIFFAASLLATQIEDRYQEWIRYLYVSLSGGKVIFVYPGKHFSFPTIFFGAFFGAWVMMVYYLLSKQTPQMILIHLALAVFLFIGCTAWACRWDGEVKQMLCTSCQDGIVRLHYNNINYNKLLASNLIMALLPLLLAEYKRRKRRKQPDAGAGIFPIQ